MCRMHLGGFFESSAEADDEKVLVTIYRSIRVDSYCAVGQHYSGEI